MSLLFSHVCETLNFSISKSSVAQNESLKPLIIDMSQDNHLFFRYNQKQRERMPCIRDTIALQEIQRIRWDTEDTDRAATVTSSHRYIVTFLLSSVSPIFTVHHHWPHWPLPIIVTGFTSHRFHWTSSVSPIGEHVTILIWYSKYNYCCYYYWY